jgi:sensor histidine kinase YesM
VKKAKNIIIHVTGWIILLVFPPLFGPGPPFSIEKILEPYMLREVTSYTLLIIFFYLNTHVLVTKFYFEKKRILYLFLVVIALCGITFIPLILVKDNEVQYLSNTFGEHSVFFEFGHNFPSFSVVTFISLVLAINKRLKDIEQQRLRAEQEILNARLSYLKAQINPHFLFNTLNSIYSLAIQKSDLTAEAVVRLSNMMRYLVSEVHQDFVSLEKEIKYIISYIELQRIRYGDGIDLSFCVEGDVASKKIGPLILISFVENAFKHGVNTEEVSRIRVAIKIDDDKLQLEVFNNKVVVHRSDEDKSGVGIENTRHRLELLYPDRHTLHINDTKNDFSVLLTLQLDVATDQGAINR